MTMGSMPSARIIGRNLPEASLQARSGSKPRGWRRRRSTSCRSVPPISKRETMWRTRRTILAEENGHRAGRLEGACRAYNPTPEWVLLTGVRRARTRWASGGPDFHGRLAVVDGGDHRQADEAGALRAEAGAGNDEDVSLGEAGRVRLARLAGRDAPPEAERAPAAHLQTELAQALEQDGPRLAADCP